ncbi:MAG: hypothetical protein K6T86_05410 [Pirellulales bacterium]|nr:hypothetical protein [Pirellulales bacterium]
MIIRRVAVREWRGLAEFKCELQPALNVLRGDNERGKSSLVEAIERALYWDHTERKRKEDRLEYIVPVHLARAKPTVELMLEVADGPGGTVSHWIISKVVAAEKRDRDCMLRILRPGGKQEDYSGETAELKLAEMLAARREAQRMLVARQGEMTCWLGSELPPSVCRAISISAGGEVTASSRLDQVRGRVEEQFGKTFKSKLAADLLDSARAETEAARLREVGKELENAIQAQRVLLGQIDELRQTVLRLKDLLELGEPARAEIEQTLQARRELRTRQDAASRQVAEAQTNVERAANLEAKLESHLNRIKELQQASARLKSELQAAEQELQAVRARTAELDGRRQAVRQERDAAQSVLTDYKRQLEAVELCREIERLRVQAEDLQKRHSRLAELANEVAEAEAALAELGPWPKGEQIGAWRKEFAALYDLQREAANKLQLDLKLQAPARVLWWQDTRPCDAVELGAQQAQAFTAVRSLQLEIEGVGTIHVRCGAKELDDLLREIERRRHALDEQVALFGLACGDLDPEAGGFDRLEELHFRGQQAQQRVKQAKQVFAEAQRQLGSEAALRDTLRRTQEELRRAESRYAPLAHHVPHELDAAALEHVAERLRQQIEQREEQYRVKAKETDGLQAQIEKARAEEAQATQRLASLRASLQSHRQEVSQLTSDGQTDAQRSDELQQLRRRRALAEEALNRQQQQLASLGPLVTDDEIHQLEQRLRQLEGQRQQWREDLVKAQTRLQACAETDPQSRLEELELARESLSVKLAAEERRLAALVVLQALLQAERRQLSNLVSEPLNRKVRPWLSAIRNRTTSVVYDPNTSRITHLRTEHNGQQYELPFEEHSDGLKDQVALVLRLVLAQDLARQLGSPQFVILDDPLVHASVGRRKQLFRILQQAAQHLQILFVTCHDDQLALLPPTAHVIEV